MHTCAYMVMCMHMHVCVCVCVCEMLVLIMFFFLNKRWGRCFCNLVSDYCFSLTLKDTDRVVDEYFCL